MNFLAEPGPQILQPAVGPPITPTQLNSASLFNPANQFQTMFLNENWTLTAQTAPERPKSKRRKAYDLTSFAHPLVHLLTP